MTEENEDVTNRLASKQMIPRPPLLSLPHRIRNYIEDAI